MYVPYIINIPKFKFNAIYILATVTHTREWNDFLNELLLLLLNNIQIYVHNIIMFINLSYTRMLNYCSK